MNKEEIINSYYYKNMVQTYPKEFLFIPNLIQFESQAKSIYKLYGDDKMLKELELFKQKIDYDNTTTEEELLENVRKMKEDVEKTVVYQKIKLNKTYTYKRKNVIILLQKGEMTMENNLECTYVMIKPDIMNKETAEREEIISNIIDRYNEKGLDVIAMTVDKLSIYEVREHYAHLKEEDFFGDLIYHMTSGDVLKMVVIGNNAVQEVRKINGPTNVLKAREEAPYSIRALYGNPDFGPANAIHASDSKANAEIEINRFYPDMNFKQLRFINKDLNENKARIRTAYTKNIER